MDGEAMNDEMSREEVSEILEAIYKENQGDATQDMGDVSDDNTTENSGSTDTEDETVVDADFEEVKDKKE